MCNVISGQWYGYFSYGPDYGAELEGEKVTFSFLIEEKGGGEFTGKCIELNGIGASKEVSTIKGFLEGDTISFQKEYKTPFAIDERGNEIPPGNGPMPPVSYLGKYNNKSDRFSGDWEIWVNEEAYGDGTFVDLCTGVWEMGRNASQYGI